MVVCRGKTPAERSSGIYPASDDLILKRHGLLQATAPPRKICGACLGFANTGHSRASITNMKRFVDVAHIVSAVFGVCNSLRQPYRCMRAVAMKEYRPNALSESNWPGERNPSRNDVRDAIEVPDRGFLSKFKTALLASPEALDNENLMSHVQVRAHRK